MEKEALIEGALELAGFGLWASTIYHALHGHWDIVTALGTWNIAWVIAVIYYFEKVCDD